MTDLARCQCGEFANDPAYACTALATQEDLLCDDCRKGCTWGIAGQPHRSSEIKFEWSLRTPAP